MLASFVGDPSSSRRRRWTAGAAISTTGRSATRCASTCSTARRMPGPRSPSGAAAQRVREAHGVCAAVEPQRARQGRRRRRVRARSRTHRARGRRRPQLRQEGGEHGPAGDRQAQPGAQCRRGGGRQASGEIGRRRGALGGRRRAAGAHEPGRLEAARDNSATSVMPSCPSPRTSVAAVSSGGFMDRLFGDLVSGIRMLVRYPTLSLGAIADARPRHRPEHDRVLRRQWRHLQGPAIPQRRSHRLGLFVEPLAGAAAPSDLRPRSRRFSGAADLVRGARRIRRRAVTTCPSKKAGRNGSLAGS